MEAVMKDTVKALLISNPRGAIEDLVGLVALFELVFTVLSVPSLI
jgi:hypothetical protein